VCGEARNSATLSAFGLFAALLGVSMPRNTLLEFGAGLHARIDRAAGGWRASYRLVDGNGNATAIDMRIFGNDRDAGAWLYNEARRRGFQSIS
jgi:hypothetical protein